MNTNKQNFSLLKKQPLKSVFLQTFVFFFLLCLLVLPVETTAQQYNVAGNAFANGGPGCYTLTNTTGQSGAVWNVNTINLTQPIDITLTLNFGCNDLDNYPDPNCGADGMSFVLQPNGTGSFGSGGGVGFNGLTPSFGVVMDTYENGPDDNIAFDNGVDHISINTNGNVIHGSVNELAPPSVGAGNGFPANIEDCNSHTFRFVWTPGTVGGTAAIYFDGVLTTSYTGDIVANIFGGNPVVYWGVSGSTGGCWNVQTVCMTVVASFITVGNYCAGSSINFQDQSISGTTINSWDWDFGDGSGSTLQNPSHSYSSSGTYQVSLSITNIAGFSSTITQEVTILSPIVSIDSIGSVCEGDQVTLQGQADPFPPTVLQLFPFNNNTLVGIPDGGVTAGWTGTGGTFASSGIPVTGLTAGWSIESVCFNINHTYDGDLIIYLQDPCGNLMLLSNGLGGSSDNYTNTCFSPSATGSITTGFAPFSGTWIPQAGAGAWTTLTGCATPNGTWNLLIGDEYNSDSGSLIDWSITFNNDVPVNLTYLWQPLNINNTLNPVFTASTSGWYSLTAIDDFSCSASDSVYLTVNPLPVVLVQNDTICSSEQASLLASGATSYIWNTSSTTNPLLVSPAVTTTYSVTGSSNGCSATATAQVYVNAGLNITVNNETICEGEQAILDPVGADAYVWNTTAIDDPYIVQPIITTNYTVTGTSIAGCSGTTSATVVVNPNPVITINTNAVCEGDQAQLLATGANSYDWSTGFAGNPLLETPASSTLYSVTGTSLGCTGTAEIFLDVYPLPIVSFTPSVSSGCSPLEIQFNDQSAPSIVNWSWSFGDGSTSNVQNPTNTYLEPGNYQIQLEVKDVNGCVANSLPENIVVYSAEAHIITNGHVFSSGDGVSFFDGSLNANSWLWGFGEGSFSSMQNPTFVYDNPGEYNVILSVESPEGCMDSDSILIIVNPLFTVYFPTAFTPNNDGKNDSWIPYGESWNPEFFEMDIYNRWGTLVFRSTDINNPWSGKSYDGIVYESAVFAYRVKIKDVKEIIHVYEGSITLVR
ncbi:MAG: hypothetical protein CVU11_00190 [Bacteroidetes bacterium HGW-Bacteroidetes-6]|jgi:gliding motility-associated-like protein|nr:MAG: hypothetical protein CVU11_00190 [Bacteroidetes bacterium HGW-Bacteroidetes-6]